MIKCGSQSQIIRYAKGWFKQTDLIDDLKVLYADYCLVYKDQVRIGEIRALCVHICEDVGAFDKHGMHKFIEYTSPEMYYRHVRNGLQYMGKPHPDYDYDIAVISTCMSMLACLTCVKAGAQIIEIDEPNYNLLPPHRCQGCGTRGVDLGKDTHLCIYCTTGETRE